MEILTQLHADHDALREMIIDLEITPGDFEAKRSHLLRVTAMAESVFKSEESVVLEWALGLPQVKAIGLGLLQKQEIAEALLRTIRVTVTEELWDANVTVYNEAVLSYIYEFERYLFPRIFDALGSEDRRALGLRYSSYRRHSQSREALNLGALAKPPTTNRAERISRSGSLGGRIVG